MPTITDNYFPGVHVIEKPFQPGADSTAQVVAFGAFVGRSDQGPIVPTEVRSWVDFVDHFGTNFTDLHNAVYDFFTNGGRRAFVVRLPGDGAEVASLPVYDSTVVPPLVEPFPTPLFTATAANPGAWGNQLRLVTYDRDPANFRFDVALFRLPVGVTVFDPTKRNTELLIDQWIDVSLFPDDPRYFYTVANRPSDTGSNGVVFAGQSYDPATPSVRPLPGSAGGDELVGGVEGTYVTPWDPAVAYAAGVASMSVVPGPFILNLPNVSSAPIVKSAIQAVAARGDGFVVCDPPLGQTPSQMVTYVNTDLGLSAFGSAIPSFGALYYPQVHMPAINSRIPGRTQLRPAGGGIVGAFMAIDDSFGPWRAPAGRDRYIGGALQVERALSEADLTVLNNNNINALRIIQGAGVSIMGARTFKKSGKDMYVNVRRAVIEITENLKGMTEFSLFENNNEQLWEALQAVCSRYLDSVYSVNGLKGNSPEQAYFVRCDSTNNTPQTIEQGVVNIEVGVSLSTPAEFIVITIGQYEGATITTVTV